MPKGFPYKDPSPAGRRLAAELRKIREKTGMSGDAVAGRLKWSASKVSRFERALTCIRPADVEKQLRLYQVPEDQLLKLVALAERAWTERTLEESDRFAVSEVLAWAPTSVPRILRTTDYHRAVILTTAPISPISPGMIRAALDRNTIWQARLTDEDPIRVRAVLDWAVLMRQRGDRPVMRDQIQLLADLSRRENVDLRVLPPLKGGPSHLPPFTYTRFAESDALPDDEVEVTTLCEPWAAGSERDVWLHYLAFEQLYGAAEPAGDQLKAAMAEWS